jgi:hypothetical protein
MRFCLPHPAPPQRPVHQLRRFSCAALLCFLCNHLQPHDGSAKRRLQTDAILQCNWEGSRQHMALRGLGNLPKLRRQRLSLQHGYPGISGNSPKSQNSRSCFRSVPNGLATLAMVKENISSESSRTPMLYRRYSTLSPQQFVL